MNPTEKLKICASVLLAAMLVGMPLYLVTATVFGAELELERPHPEFEMELPPFNRLPECIMDYPTTIHMTTWTEINLENAINVDDYFTHSIPNIELNYSFEYPEDAVNVIINDNHVETVMAFNKPGEFFLTVLASDGVNQASYEILLRIEPREFITMSVDSAVLLDMSQYIPHPEYVYEIVSPQQVTTTLNLSDDAPATMTLTPMENWYGIGVVSVRVFDSPYSLPTPPPKQEIQSWEMDSDVSVPGFTYGLFEFDVAVRDANKPPVIDVPENVRLTMTTETYFELDSPVDLNNIFSDEDSELSYSWMCDNGLVQAEILGSKFYGLRSMSGAGDDIITILAHDKEYVVSYSIPVSVIPRTTVVMDEDTRQILELDDYMDITRQEYAIFGTSNIATEKIEDESEIPKAELIPNLDWFGRDAITLAVNPIYVFIPPRPPFESKYIPPIAIVDPIPKNMEAPSETSDSLSSTYYLEYGYYEFDINVEKVNKPPVVIWTPTISMLRNTPLSTAFNIKECFYDRDDELDYFVEQESDAPVEATIHMGGTVSLTPDENWFGTYELTIAASDGEYTVMTDVIVIVEYENYAPFLTGADDTVELYEDTTATIYLTDYIRDLDHELEYTFVSTNENWTIYLNESDWSMTVVPDENWFGVINATIYGFDGEFTVGRNLTFKVLPVNDPPEIITDMEHATFDLGASLELNMAEVFFDVDSDLVYMAYSRDGNVHATISGETLTVRAADDNWWGTDVLTIAATDGEFIVELELLIHVQHVNRAPMARTEPAELRMRQNTQFALMVGELFYDPDGDALSYYFESGDELMLAFDGDSGTLYLTPANNWNGMSWLKITADDGRLQTSVETSVLVTPVNMPPVQVSSIPPVDTVPGISTLVNLSAHFSDPEGSMLMYHIVGTEHITVSPGPTNGVFILEISPEWEGVENLQVTVSDGIETIHGELTVSSRETQVAGASAMDIGIIQSMGWMILGMVVAVLLFVTYTASKNRRPDARTVTNKGRIL